MNKVDHKDCLGALLPIRDALDAIHGKWKLLIYIAVSNGNNRFREIERSIPGISSKVLAKELKELEEHQLIKRTVYDATPALVEYTVTEYSKSLEVVLQALNTWGTNHRKKIMGKR
ncbi:helix-turn-helix transcriptional regulator [Panacibacter sp. DH6]|uniref:Helix-turn-helix transcriptional regulator n=1 Tax=Panacibacter microcysteis TaxID=2793269 RepID=A0A931E7B1_9BACT|nr:helix-turn-helix domain-containing protein [Panacibacter microcysteis]MBG9377507.1 helix-turn-helix transcriptional regulator [Panacibacter microcysteis]